jgi:hypothetical protein
MNLYVLFSIKKTVNHALQKVFFKLIIFFTKFMFFILQDNNKLPSFDEYDIPKQIRT